MSYDSPGHIKRDCPNQIKNRPLPNFNRIPHIIMEGTETNRMKIKMNYRVKLHETVKRKI